MSRRYGRVLTVLLAVVFAASLAAAEVALPPLFGDHMVLQQGKNLPVWGTANPGEEVCVTLSNRSARTTAGDDGQWRVRLKSLKAGGSYQLHVAGSSNEIRLKDVLVGEVWVCSGQSNMQWNVKSSNNAKVEIAAADLPGIRLYTVPNTVAGKPRPTCGGTWTVCSPASIPGFSAVGYFFGRELHQELDVPVGLIHSSWGGTPAESWTRMETLEANPDFASILSKYHKAEKNYPKAKAKYNEAVEAWKKQAQQAKEEGKPAPRKPRPPVGPSHPWRPSGLYNAMIHPVAPFAIQGAIWYQGESNADRGKQYRSLFPAMIEDWRRLWGQGPFSFYFVQLANFYEQRDEPQVDSQWAELREAQTKTLDLKNTGMAVIIDIGEAKDVHPRNKQDVGKRLALNALAKDYGRKAPYSGPTLRKMRIKNGEARLSFKHTDGGLVAKGGEPLKGFIVAGEDGKFVWAEARIEDKEVVVSAPGVPEPTAVRYAWADNPDCNLYNGAGLPASPFRSDPE